MGLAVTAGFLPCHAEKLIEEDFSKDPGWTVVGMDGLSSFGWNSALQSIAEPGGAKADGKFLRRQGWDAYYKQLHTPITEKMSFILRGDVKMTSEQPYARIYLGLFDQDAGATEKRNAIYIERSRNPKQHYLKVYAVDQTGELKVETKYHGLKSAEAAQAVEVSYAAETRTLNWSVDGKDLEPLVLPENFHFSANACGVTNSFWSSGTTDYLATGQVDNISLELSSPSKP